MCIARLKIATLAALACLAVTAARAADMPLPPPQAEPCCNWYLRGFVGVGMTHSDQMQYSRIRPMSATISGSTTPQSATSVLSAAPSAMTWNNWLRFDGSAEYRSKARVDAFGHYTVACTDSALNPEAVCDDTYQGYVKSWVFLANAYVDLGTWWCLTPFVGAGIGGAYNQLVQFQRPQHRPTAATASAATPPNGTWPTRSMPALPTTSARISRSTSPTAISTTDRSPTRSTAWAAATPNSYKFGNLYSHDFMIGLRWTCCDVEQPRVRLYAAAAEQPRLIDTKSSAPFPLTARCLG